MGQLARRNPPLDVEEYLQAEQTSLVKHEFVGGEVYAMSGASRRHNRIAGATYARLLAAAGADPCRVYMADVKLRAARDIVYYPDVMVACGPETGDPYVEDQPCLVVEVLSPSTEQIDRREKLLVYKQIPSLRAYLIVSQERRHVEYHQRDEQGAWWSTMFEGDGGLALPCPATELSLAEIYAGLDIPA